MLNGMEFQTVGAAYLKALMVYPLWRYWQGITPSDSVKVRHSPTLSLAKI